MKCRAPGELSAGGRVVATVRCELEAGHDVEKTIEITRPDGATIVDRVRPTPHRYTLEWESERTTFEAAAEPDVEVPLDDD